MYVHASLFYLASHAQINLDISRHLYTLLKGRYFDIELCLLNIKYNMFKKALRQD